MAVFLAISVFLFLTIFTNFPPPIFSLELSILHVNDFHARYEETNDAGGSCKSDECIGGFSRLYNEIEGILEENPDFLLLNAGDNFQGTLYYNLFKWNVTQYFLNKLPFDAIVLGNHEFDDGIAGVVPFIQHLKAPVIVSNIDDSLEPDLQGLYNKSIVVERGGKKIGIIGVITKTTNQISNTEKLSFLDESESINKEGERLVKEEGVFTNIVLSHSGYDVEEEMARKATAASKISVIVGGHSHTFLYTGTPSPGPDTPAGPYPTIISRDDDGEQVLVVQASCYSKYLGNISVSFDDNGNVEDWIGSPIFLENSLAQDEDINKELQPWKEEVDSLGDKVIGSTLVTLNEDGCYSSECLLGNFVTDAMVYSYSHLDEDSWTYASLAVMNPGGLRTPIERGDITYNDVSTAQPFEDTWNVGEIEGKYIKEMFEYCFQNPYDFGRAYVDISLLQVSGFHIIADMDESYGSRVQSVKVRCQNCTIPVYEDLEPEETYRLILPSFLQGGGDGFTVLQDNLKNARVGRVDIDVLVEYLGHKSPIFQEIEGRIVILNGEDIKAKNAN